MREFHGIKHYVGCADSLKEDDPRLSNYKQQLEERGWDDTYTWNIDIAIVQFAIPLIEHHLKNLHNYPSHLTFNEWKIILTEMIDGMKLYGDFYSDDQESERKKELGMKNFHEYFTHLWN